MKNIYRYLLILCLMAGSFSCELEPELYDALPAEGYPSNDQEFQTVIGAAYRGLLLYYDREVYMTLNSSTDTWTAPTRGGGAWFDKGRWIYFADHTWDASAGDFEDNWNWLYTGIARCNNTLSVLKASEAEVEGKSAALAELRGLRAFFYYLLMDNFGSVPIKTEDSPNGNIPQSSRSEVFDFVESELFAIIPDLKATNHPSTYSKFTKETAHTLLAKIYLNAEIYTGTAQWDKVIAQCNEVIKGPFAINSSYFEDFAPDNRSNGSHIENIFVIPYDNVDYKQDDFSGMSPNLFTMHPGLKDKYGLSESPWNGFSAIAEHYNSFDDEDIRKTGWIAGPQVDANGDPILWNGSPLILNVDFDNLAQAGDNDGARMIKFGMQSGNPFRLQDNHFPIFRFADVLMMKGEAALRNGDIGTAVDMFNLVRERTGLEPYTAATLTLDEILAERGREFYFEMWRRNDMVRFDKFGNGTWRFKEKQEAFRDLYPIPNDEISKNPLLVQNPGY